MESAKGGKLLHLACRHLISELILAHVFSLHDVSKYPSIENIHCVRMKSSTQQKVSQLVQNCKY